jgi:hypothetical protein
VTCLSEGTFVLLKFWLGLSFPFILLQSLSLFHIPKKREHQLVPAKPPSTFALEHFSSLRDSHISLDFLGLEPSAFIPFHLLFFELLDFNFPTFRQATDYEKENRKKKERGRRQYRQDAP